MFTVGGTLFYAIIASLSVICSSVTPEPVLTSNQVSRLLYRLQHLFSPTGTIPWSVLMESLSTSYGYEHGRR